MDNIEFKEAIFRNLKLQLPINTKKKNVLYLLHVDFKEGTGQNIGGTQLHVKDLTMGLKKENNIFVIAREGSYLLLTIYLNNYIESFRFLLNRETKYDFSNNERERDIYCVILKVFNIDIVHIHHMRGLSLDIIREASNLNIPIIITLHDYYFLCPTIRMLDTKNQRCIEKIEEKRCQKCLKENLMIRNIDYKNYLIKRKQQVRDIFCKCDKIIVPSKSVKLTFIKYFPEIEEKILLISHGSHKFNITINNVKKDKKDFHVAFLGDIQMIKGSETIYNLIIHSSKNIRWFIFGGIADEKLKKLKKPNLEKRGWYKREELPNLLKENSIDVICILSIVPETFCYTLSEAVMNQIPVIVRDIGVLGERVREMNSGWIVPIDATYKEVIKVIEQIKNNSQEYTQKIDNLKNVNIKTVKDMLNDYQLLYNKYKKRECIKEDIQAEDIQKIIEAYVLQNFKSVYNVYQQNEAILSSTSYKLSLFFRKIFSLLRARIKGK